jgi:hypothetical protein
MCILFGAEQFFRLFAPERQVELLETASFHIRAPNSIE